MDARPPLPRARDVLLALVIGLLVLGSLRAGGRWGPPGGGDGAGGSAGSGDPTGTGGPSGSGDPTGFDPPWPGGPFDPAGPLGSGADAIGIGAFLLAGAAVLAVVLRRWPLPAFALSVLATSLFLLVGGPYGPVLLTVLVTAYGLGREMRLPQAGIAAAAGIGLLVLHAVVRSPGLEGWVAVLPGSAWVVVPFSIGLARRLVVEAGRRERQEAERRALDAERLRLASEVHDIVGHGLAAIQMQADIALHVHDRRPEQARTALEVISRASAEALAELRTTLAAIAPAEVEGGARDAAKDSRAEGPGGGDAARESRAPTPGMARLEDLCSRMREAGIAVRLEVTGDRRALPPAVDVAAYRIVQESLTNVAKHASQRRADVRVHWAGRPAPGDHQRPRGGRPAAGGLRDRGDPPAGP